MKVREAIGIYFCDLKVSSCNGVSLCIQIWLSHKSRLARYVQWEGMVLRSLVKQAKDVIESDIKYILANFTAVVLEVIRFLGLKYVIASM